jgi:hypothetical protein
MRTPLEPLYRLLIMLALCTVLLFLATRDRRVRDHLSSLLSTLEQEDVQRYRAPPAVEPRTGMCGAASTAYAVASTLPRNYADTDMHITAACKLASSVKRLADIDMVLLIGQGSTNLTANQMQRLSRCGWSTCMDGYVEPGGVYWAPERQQRLAPLRQYEAVLYLSPVSLVVRPFQALFETELPRMTATNRSMAMARHPAFPPHARPALAAMDAGVILLAQGEHRATPHEIHALPARYNAIVSYRKKQQSLWTKDEPVILQYDTVPWGRDCRFYGVEDLCLLWHWW